MLNHISDLQNIADQLYKSFKPSDLEHVKFVLGLDGNGGFTPQIAHDVADKFMDLATRIIERAHR